MDLSGIETAIRGAKKYLSEHPDAASYRDSEAVAVAQDGLLMRVEGDGWTMQTDMSKGVGGTAAAPSPGWIMRASLASCVATLITMRGAELGVELVGLRVAVDSESDDRGILGMVEGTPPGPLTMRVRVSVDPGAQEASLVREVIEWGFEHCPICDALQRSVPVEHIVELRGANGSRE